MPTTRATLLLRVKNPRDTVAWQEFENLYRPLLLHYARAHGLAHDVAQDVAQDCMASIAQHIGNFEYDPEKGGFKNWLRTMARRKVYDFFRKRKEAGADSAVFDRPDSRQDSPEQVFDQLYEKQHIRYCMERLRQEVPSQRYAAFEAYAIGQKSASDVAELLGITQNQVYLAKSRLLERIREIYAESFGEECPD